MKKIVFALLFGSLFTLTSCIDVLEEMRLNRNGSGSYSLSFDMSSLLEDPTMKSMMEQMLKSEGDIQIDGLRLGDGDALEIDTVMYLKDTPEAASLVEEKPKLWESVQMKMQISESKKKMITSLNMEFEDVEDIDYFFRSLEKAGAGNAMAGGMLGSNGIIPTGRALFKLKKKQLVREAPEVPKEATEGDQMDMAKMFLAMATYRTVYHLPGKVKKVSIADAKIDGKTVTVDIPFLDILEGKAKLEGTIKYK